MCSFVMRMGFAKLRGRNSSNVATEMALNVLAYNMKRVIAILGVSALMEALKT